MTLIPLRRRDGSVAAFAEVDDADAAWVNRWRWKLLHGYVARSQRDGGRGSACRVVLLHRALLGLERGDLRQGDHINRDRLDNRRSNLRVVDRFQQAQNVRSQRGSTSRFRGVSRDSQRGGWRAYAWVSNRHCFLGRFATEREAAQTARSFRLKHMAGAVD